ncbi:uncharacterized protein [Dermacentor andersoni]|uniref:uncharacterized protein n=1 Tax=Dermacentor andersoni TaxID=34620 RepID=UPI0024180B37|nr:nascent polypeptide-associated complex subunit alpha, muscle-specific form-like [Dermacentor andersoni]
MKSRSRTTSSHWLAGVKRPTSPSIRSPKTPSNVVVATPLAPAQVVIQGGWTPSGLAINVARHHSRSIASSHDSEVSMLMNDARLCATGSRSVEDRFSGLPSLPESNKSTEFNGSLSALVTRSAEKTSATSTGKSTGSLFWSKSPFIEIQPMVRSSKSATIKRSSVATASSASAAKAAVFERHNELAASPADSPIKHRGAFHSSDSATSLGKRWNVKMSADTARGLLGQTAPEMAISEQYEKLSEKRHVSSATSRSSILKTPRTSQASFASPRRQNSQELVSQGSHLTLPLTSPGPHIAEVTIASVEINPIVQARGGFRPSSPESYPGAHSVYHKSALDKLFNKYPMDFAEKHALARARRDASKNSLSVLTQSARGQIAKLKKTSKTKLSKSGESRQLTTLASQKSSREAFTKPTLLQPASDAPSRLTDYQRFKDLKSETITARTLFATGKEPQGIAEFGVTAGRKILGEAQTGTKTTISVSPRSSGSLVNVEAPQKPSLAYPTSIIDSQRMTALRKSVDKGSQGSPLGSRSVFSGVTSPRQLAEIQSGAPSRGLLEPMKRLSPSASPQVSNSVFTGASTQQSLIKGAPTVAKAERTAVVMESAATSPFAEQEVEMKSAITSLSPREAASAPADTVLRLKADTSSPRSGQSVLGTVKTSTGSQEKSTQVSASVAKSPIGSRPGSPKGALSAYLDAISPPQSPEPWSPRATAGFLDATKSPRPDYRSPSPRSGQGVPGSLSTSTGAQKISTQVSASVVTKTPTGSRPGSPKGALSEYLDAILPPYSPELWSPRATVGLLDATKSPRPDAPSAPQVSKSPFGSEASAEMAIIKRASPITDMEPKDGLIRRDIIPASTRDKSPALTAAPPSLQVAEASSLRTPQPFSEVAKTTAIAHPESSQFSGSQPGSPVCKQSSLVVASALEPWSPRAASGFLDPTKSPLRMPGTSPQASQGLSSQPLSPRATSGVLDPTKSPLRRPGTSPQASQGALSPEPLSPRAASGFLDQTKSARESLGATPSATQGAQSSAPLSPRGTSDFIDQTKSTRESLAASPPATQSAQSSEPLSIRVAPGFLDQTKSTRESLAASPSATQGGQSSQPLSPQATSGVLVPSKSPLRMPGTSPQASQGALSSQPLSPRAASGFLDQTKGTRESLEATPSATQGAQSSVPLSPRGTSDFLDQTKSTRESLAASPPVTQSAQSSEPLSMRAAPGFLDQTKSIRDSLGATPSATQGAQSSEPLSPRAASSLLDSTKSPRKSPGTSPQASQDSIYPVADSYSQVKQLEPWSPKVTAGTLDSTKSPRLAVQPSPPASNGSLQQTSLQQIQSPQPPVGPLSAIKSPLTPYSQVSASISQLESVQQLVNPSSTIMEIITTEKTAIAPVESGVATERASTEMSAISTRGSVSTFGLAEHPVAVFAPSPSDTHAPLDTVKSPSQSSIGSPRRALNALGPASPTPTSGLASPSEIKRLLEAKGSSTSFSPLRGSSTVDIPSLEQFPTESERHDLAKTETTTVRSAEERAGAETSLTQKGSELKVPSGPLVTAQTTDSEQKASAGGSSQLTILSAVEKSLREESPSGRGLAELDKEKSSVTALNQAAGTGTSVEGHQLSIRASAELLAPSSKSSEERISADQIIDARQLEADTSAEIIESTKSGDKSVALLVEKRASADIVAAVQKKPSDSGVASAEKSAITSPESDAKGSPQKKKGKKGQKGRKVPKGSTASTDDDSLSVSEHIAQAITESSAQFADIPLQVNMTIDLVPPKSANSMSSVRTIVSPVHIEKKMIVESCKDGHVEVKIPPVFIDSPEGKHTSDNALNVSVSVDVGKQATQGHKTPQQECRPAEKP